nr:betaine/proline/choline family ABC transporter ATP-binding protein [Lentibacillus sp. JNUCC-1]
MKSISLDFQDEKINVLIGPSGCGKTTTMKLLNKLIDYTEGTILMNGKNIQEINTIELRREMGYVIQNIGLFPHMTIFNNVAAVPKLLKWDKKRIEKKVHELLTMVNLDPDTYKNRYPSELSGGQQQRIGVIRALAADPDIILMDEPFSALDPISRDQLQDELIRLQKEIKKTIIFVTHDMDEAIKIADQIILMKDGEVVQRGAPSELLANPANDFVKEFIGPKRLLTHESALELRRMINTDTPTVRPDESIEETLKIMIDKQISYVPVVSEDKKFKGIVSIYDAIAQSAGSVKEITHNPPELIREGHDAAEALNIMAGSDASLFPVVAEDNTFIGVIHNHDHMKLLEENVAMQGGSAK